MSGFDLTHRFRKQLENAISSWEKGEEQTMIDLLYRVQAESFAEGCACMKEQIEGFLGTKTGGDIGGDRGRVKAKCSRPQMSHDGKNKKI